MNQEPPNNHYTPSLPKNKNLSKAEKALKKECQKILEGTDLASMDKISIRLDATFKKHLKEFTKIERQSIEEVKKLTKEAKAKPPRPGKNN